MEVYCKPVISVILMTPIAAEVTDIAWKCHINNWIG